MIIKPRVRGFICVTTHPVGCEANVKRQIDYVTAQGPIAGGPKRVLVIGASTGYGLAARITAAFACDAQTLGVFFERPGSDSKAGTPGWYNTAAFHQFAEAKGLYAISSSATWVRSIKWSIVSPPRAVRTRRPAKCSIRR
jgi:enoyl-[acyl-carrier protein] reductase/trans-2-enoyl-CoA reductase (NAD+)